VAATEEEITCSSPVPGGKFPFFKRPEFAWFFGVLSVFSPIIPHCFLSVLVPYLRCFLGALAPTHRLLKVQMPFFVSIIANAYNNEEK